MELPALSLAAMPGRRQRVLELAVEIERRGFSGIFAPSANDVMGLCRSLAHLTERITFGPSIQPIYLRHALDLAPAASAIHELSDGRFRLGLGVSHGPVHTRLGVEAGRPLSDMRAYVEAVRGAEPQAGPLPPIVLATLRDRMLGLAVEIADGAVWANAARSYMATQLTKAKPPAGFFVGNMIPTVIDDDEDAAKAVLRRILTGYAALPNYRTYWATAGYEEGDLLGDRWLADVTLFGSASKVRDGVDAWREAGVTTPIIVASSTSGGQAKALEEVFAAFG